MLECVKFTPAAITDYAQSNTTTGTTFTSKVQRVIKPIAVNATSVSPFENIQPVLLKAIQQGGKAAQLCRRAESQLAVYIQKSSQVKKAVANNIT